jgi:hypothetical protein
MPFHMKHQVFLFLVRFPFFLCSIPIFSLSLFPHSIVFCFGYLVRSWFFLSLTISVSPVFPLDPNTTSLCAFTAAAIVAMQHDTHYALLLMRVQAGHS